MKTYSDKEAKSLTPKTYGAWVNGGNTWGVARAYDKKNAADSLGVSVDDLQPNHTIVNDCVDFLEFSHAEQVNGEVIEYLKISKK